MNITYREGRKEDCAQLAEFIYIASDGVVEYLFRRYGFEIVSPVAMEPHELIPHEGGAYLMGCTLE